ncbi:MAG: integrase [Solimicrobium sp.]|nr:integrase [Solimicrobium sp.]
MTEKNSNSQIVDLAKPFETLLSASSDGSNGATVNKPQIAANTDVDAIKAWLARFTDTKTTFDNYRKEAERLLSWSTITLQKPLSSLTHKDMLLYSHF